MISLFPTCSVNCDDRHSCSLCSKSLFLRLVGIYRFMQDSSSSMGALSRAYITSVGPSYIDRLAEAKQPDAHCRQLPPLFCCHRFTVAYLPLRAVHHGFMCRLATYNGAANRYISRRVSRCASVIDLLFVFRSCIQSLRPLFPVVRLPMCVQYSTGVRGSCMPISAPCSGDV